MIWAPAFENLFLSLSKDEVFGPEIARSYGWARR